MLLYIEQGVLPRLMLHNGGGNHPQIKLSTKSFNPEAAEVLSTGIRNVPGSLVDADLSDIIAGAPLPAPPPVGAAARSEVQSFFSPCLGKHLLLLKKARRVTSLKQVWTETGLACASRRLWLSHGRLGRSCRCDDNT